MEKINITIPNNLDLNGELLAIAEQLGKKLLPTNKKLLGSGYELKHLETQINIKRESVEKPIVTRECSVCSTIFEQKISKKLWVNYGGSQKQKHYCSDGCRDTVLQLVSKERGSINRKDLTPIRSY